ncbi:MAG: hypothetical protein J6K45_04920 [Clostridia bacterium]|nr:hypothetical protein [Clostridia bacterium]
MQKKSNQKNKRKQVGDIVVFVGENYIIPQIYNYKEKLEGKKLIVKDVIKCTCHDYDMDYLIFEGIEGYFRAGFFKLEGE